MKKIVALMLALCMTLCAAAAMAEEKTYEIGICQLLQHPALDEATRGFRDALTEKLGDKVKFDEQNASGEAVNCATIVNTFVSNDVDLIMAHATASLQAAISATDTIPILGTSITDYATALGATEFDGTSGINVSGTSDLAPLDGQAAMIQELFPDAKTVALFYCSAEANSVYQINTIKGYLTEMGYECAKPDGAFYLFVKAPNGDANAFSEKAKLEHNLLVVPADGFGCPGYFRLSYCVANDMIQRSLPAFKAMIESYK